MYKTHTQRKYEDDGILVCNAVYFDIQILLFQSNTLIRLHEATTGTGSLIDHVDRYQISYNTYILARS